MKLLGRRKQSNAEPEKSKEVSVDLHPELVEYRRDFIPRCMKKLSKEQPALCINGDLNDEIVDKDNKRITVLDQILEELAPTNKKNEIQGTNFDFILSYDAAQGKIFFADEHSSLGGPKENRYMRAGLSGDGVDIELNDGGTIPPLDVLLDPNIFVHSGCYKPAMLMARVMEQIQEQGKTFCLIMDNSEEAVGNDSLENHSARILQIIQGCLNTDNRIIFLDRRSRIDERITQNALSYQLPGTTEKDAALLLSPYLKGERLALAAKLSVRTRAAHIIRLADEHGNSDNFFDTLRTERARAIEKDSGGVLKASFQKLDPRAISLPAEHMSYWENMAEACKKDPRILGNGSLLIGPPGTGKSIVPKYLASLLGLPYVELVDLSTSGLSNLSLDRAKQAFEALRAHAPCILRVDEISKMFPNIEKSPFRSNNDQQLMAYIQTVLSDDDFMKGIMVIGTDNFPEDLPTALLRHGRFGNKIAMLPPQSVDEKVGVFKALWYQKPLLHESYSIPSDELIANIVQDLPDFTMGGDYGELLDRVTTHLFSKQSDSVWGALQVCTDYMGKTLTPVPRYQEIMDKSIEMHNAFEINHPVAQRTNVVSVLPQDKTVASSLPQKNVKKAVVPTNDEKAQEVESDIILLSKEQANAVAFLEKEAVKVETAMKMLKSKEQQDKSICLENNKNFKVASEKQTQFIEGKIKELKKQQADLLKFIKRVRESKEQQSDFQQRQINDLRKSIENGEKMVEAMSVSVSEVFDEKKEEILSAQEKLEKSSKKQEEKMKSLKKKHKQIIENATLEIKKAFERLEEQRNILETDIKSSVDEAIEAKNDEFVTFEKGLDSMIKDANHEISKKENALQQLKNALQNKENKQGEKDHKIADLIKFIESSIETLQSFAPEDMGEEMVQEKIASIGKDLDEKKKSLAFLLENAMEPMVISQSLNPASA